MRAFDTFVCIDWSGQAVARPKGIALAWCHAGAEAPTLAAPAGGWSRQGVLEWLLGHADAGTSMIVGLDLSPALPFADCGAYFPGMDGSPEDARSLWAMIEQECAADDHLGASSFPLKPAFRDHFRNQIGRQTLTGQAFGGGSGRFRVAEHRQRLAGVNPVSCFNLVGAAQVGKSSLTGMRLLHRLNGRVPVWPFDRLPPRGPVIVEIYTSIAARAAGLRKGISKIRDGETLDRALAELGSASHRPMARYDDHATDAILTAAWLRQVAHRSDLWNPAGLDDVAQTEGWTFGAV
ncbi:MAG: hypothetical protein ACKOPO_10785 [Novosphingobium sp.]